jgi:hypothetical protein
MLKSQFEIQDTDPEADTVSRIAAGLQAVAPQVQAILPYVNQLLGVPPGQPGVADMDPQMRKARLFEALGDLLAAAAAIRPLILTLEDIHWIDRISEELLSYLLDRLANFRVLILLSYRTGYNFRFGARPSLCSATRLLDATSRTSSRSWVCRRALPRSQWSENMTLLRLGRHGDYSPRNALMREVG